MNKFNHTERSIKENIDQVFQEVQKEVIDNYFVSGNGNFSNLQNELNHNLAIKINNKKLLLLDTILNYLTDDAIKKLEGYENKVVNDFYTQNRNWQKEIKNNFQGSESNNSILSLSDPRIAYSAVAGVGGSVISGLLWKTIYSKFQSEYIIETTILFSSLSGLAYAIFAYNNTQDKAIKKLQEEVMQYLEKSKAQVQQEFLNIIQSYSDRFNQFLEEHKV